MITRSELRSKAWRRLLRDTYLPAYVDVDYRMWCYAAAASVGDAGAVAGVSAAYLHRIEIPHDERVHVVVGSRGRQADPTKLVVTRASLDPGDIVRVSGVRVTSAARTCFDLARQLPAVEAVIAVDQFCFRRVVNLTDLIAYAEARRRWPGAARALAVLGLVEPASESPMETRLRLILVFGGLPRPVANFKVMVGGRQIARLDLAYPQWKIAIEYDGDHHRDRSTFAADLRRQNRLVASGWTVLRFSATDIYRNPDTIVAQVRSLIP